MTAQEAIDTIRIAKAEVEWNYPMDYAIAFDTAIEALEKQTKTDMPIERVEQMKELAAQGITYAEIGQRMGVSRQRVWQILGAKKHSNTNITAEKCIYPNIRKYMNYNRINISKLTTLMYGTSNSSEYNKVYHALRGANCPKSIIEGILRVTGMTYEEAFGKGDME